MSYFDEKLVDVEEYSNGLIKVKPMYYLQGLKGAVDKAYLRESVAKKLLEASKDLPEGVFFQIYDAWRPFDVQKALFDNYYSVLKTDNPELSEEELIEKTKRFVSFPDKTKEVSYVHSSGGAVDLTLCYCNGKEFNMGSGFDEFSLKSNTNYFDNKDYNSYKEIIDNRNLLLNVLKKQGLTNYDQEWWHFDYGDLFWSDVTGKNIIYKSVFSLNFGE